VAFCRVARLRLKFPWSGEFPLGEDSISPDRHPDIDSHGDLLDFVSHIREVTGKSVGFKCVIGACGWLESLMAFIQSRGVEIAPWFMTIDSCDGGTGAAPMPLMDNVGIPLRESLPLVADIIFEAGLKDRIRLVASGKLITPAEVAWALCVGADFVTSARGFMFFLGCIQAMKCNKNTCPTGITTHNKRLRKGLDPIDKATKVANYCQNLVHEIEVLHIAAVYLNHDGFTLGLFRKMVVRFHLMKSILSHPDPGFPFTQ